MPAPEAGAPPAPPARDRTTANDLTLVAVDCAQPEWALRALAHSAARLPAARVLLLTDRTLDAPGIDVVTIAPIRSREAYSRFMLTGLAPFIATSHALVLQWDGFVLDASAFDREFWHYDYIGARWPHREPPYVVGNGGFSLRSRRLLQALATMAPTLAPDEAEDEAICIRLRPQLEREYGIVFADPRVADRFAFDVGHPVGPTFGFHGSFNFWQVFDAESLRAFAQEAPEAVVRGHGFAALTANLLDLRRADAARPFIERIASALGEPAARPLRNRLAGLMPPSANDARFDADAVGDDAPAIPPPPSRLAPCPCGSGRRYKDCHGALSPASPARTPSASSGTVDAEATFALGLRLHEQGQVTAALERYQQVLTVAPEHASALHFLGVALYQQGTPSAGLAPIWRSLRLEPRIAEWWSNYAAAAWASGRYDLGRMAAEQALALDPRHVGAWNNLGFNLRGLALLPESLAAFEQALAIDPTFAYARWNRTFSLLALGRYAEGFADYELRLSFAQTQPIVAPPPCPPWDGGALAGRLLVLAEQGLGDTLMFARFLPAVAERVPAVTLACHPPLVELLTRNLPQIEVVPAKTVQGREFAAWCGLWSLPMRLGVTRDTLPAPPAYLTADSQRVVRWKERLASPDDPRPTVGVIWQGQFAGQDHEMAERSLPPHELAAWLGRETAVRWLSLQWGATPLGVDGLIDLGDAIGPFEELAAAMLAVDQVITIDTGAAHLAAALGRPTWVLLRHAGEWRYGIAEREGGHCPWYPTMRLFRQGPERRWAPVLDAVAAALATDLL